VVIRLSIPSGREVRGLRKGIPKQENFTKSQSRSAKRTLLPLLLDLSGGQPAVYGSARVMPFVEIHASLDDPEALNWAAVGVLRREAP
jgi:hypothetical protein